MADTNEIKSPDALEVKGKAKTGLRIGKKAAFLVILLMAVAGMVVAINIATRKPAGLDKNAVDQTPENKKLVAATAVGAEMTRGVPDGQASAWAKNNMAGQPQPADGGNVLAPIPGSGAAPLAGPAGQPVPLGGPAVPDLSGQGPAPGTGAPQGTAPRMSNGQPALSDAELAAKKLREQREQERQRAINAGTSVEKYQSGNPNQQGQQQQPAAAALAAQLKGLQGLAPGAGGIPAFGGNNGGPNGEEPDQNRQAQKQAFLERAAAVQDTPYLPSVRKAAMSPLEIKTGTVIPAVMIDAVNSDLPGELIAQVSENVYDTATGSKLLIPQGSKLYGSYDSAVAYGQEGLLVVWKRLIFPDASTLELGGMGGSDQGGRAGFRDQVNNHYGRIFGYGLMTSLFSAAFQLSQPQQSTTTGGQLSSQQTVAAAVGTQMSQLGIEITRKNLRIQPTIEVRPGYRFVVKVNRDVVFPSTFK